MTSTAAACRVYLQNLPTHIPQDVIQQILAQYRPHKCLIDGHGNAELHFRDETSASIAVSTLNKRNICGSSISASRSAPEIVAPAPWFPPINPTYGTYAFPPYNEAIGAQILAYASSRVDFYNAIILLMKNLGLPPPFLPSTTSDSLPTPTPASAGEAEVPPGARVKRPAPSTLPQPSNSDPSAPKDTSMSAQHKVPKIAETTFTEEEEEDVQYQPPSQPVHISSTPLSSAYSSSSTRLITIDPNSTANRPNRSLIESPRVLPVVELVPFVSQSQKDLKNGSIAPKVVISDAELAANKISLAQIRAIPRFENWEPGVPNCKIFVKNLARKTTEEDLHFIFGRYGGIESVEQASIGAGPPEGRGEEKRTNTAVTGSDRCVSVRLMTGKMKGQAFVTFGRIEEAERAMQEVVGFVLHDRPMVMEFGRGGAVATPKAATSVE